ncbi:MAG: hypothetical protein MUF14_09765 [Hyphomonadaceae bacterium]|jgi:predicted transcriptional regulator|nr:hypothetical protein [Hyphomonadaceae bacterium]
MGAITIELTDEMADRLVEHASRLKTSAPELALAFVVRGIDDEEAQTLDQSLTPAEIAGLQRGLADAEAGHVVTHDEILADLARWQRQ